jgi:hypothetical protein
MKPSTTAESCSPRRARISHGFYDSLLTCTFLAEVMAAEITDPTLRMWGFRPFDQALSRNFLAGVF